MDYQVVTFWAVMGLLALNVAAMVLFGRVLNRIRALAVTITEYVETMEDDTRSTRKSVKDLIGALATVLRLDSQKLGGAQFDGASDGGTATQKADVGEA